MATTADSETDETARWPKRGARLAPLYAAFDYLLSSFFDESDRWFLWSPVLFGVGIAVYFGLSFEPPLWGGACAVFATGLWLAVAVQRGTPAAIAAAAFCIALGFALASLRTDIVAAPVLQKPWNGAIEGRVVEVERTDKGALSVTLQPLSMERMEAALPARVRLQVRFPETVVEPGETVGIRGRLMPPPEPVEPGGFDYARQVWFERLGGVGFAFTAPEHLAPPPRDWATALAGLRHRITARVQDGIGGASGAIAAALITGEQRAIPDWAADDLRNAGLAHVLSISGLHMVLFGGSLFWLVRAAFALIPGVALRYPIKKWGAAAALLGSTGYLMISGAQVATQRSWIMIALMFVAILFDRPALSMRNVALAALVVLAWQPESLLGASFQMSFAAVVALIAFYESPAAQRFTSAMNERGDGPVIASLRFAFNHLAGIMLTTTVAGFATGAFAAYHFDRVALYSMAGNLGALPIVSVLVMPAALAALILMPFGLERPALWVMGKGVDGMLWVAHQVSGWSGADRLIASAPLISLALLTLGGLWLALWRGSWRLAGLAPLALSLVLWDAGARPDVLVDRDGALAAVRGTDGLLGLTSAKPAYTAEQWLKHDGDERDPKTAAQSASLRCDAEGCVWREEGRPLVAFSKGVEALGEDCERADIVIAAVPVPRRMRARCRAQLVIDRFDLWRNGAVALYYEKDGEIRMATAREERGARPWVQRQKAAKPGSVETAGSP